MTGQRRSARLDPIPLPVPASPPAVLLAQLGTILTEIEGHLTRLRSASDSDGPAHLSAALAAVRSGRALIRGGDPDVADGDFVQPVAVGGLVHAALDRFAGDVPATVEIRRAIDGRAGEVLADPSRLTAMLDHLFANAGRAIGGKAGILEVTLSRLSGDSRTIRAFPQLRAETYLELIVSDTGEGIDRTILDHIFNPFFTPSVSGARPGERGLALVQQVVQSMNGLIRVFSEPGMGTTFHIYLPEYRPASGGAAHVDPGDGELPGGATILLVDDEAGTVEAVDYILSGLGFTVHPMTEVREALARFQSDPAAFDLLITDQSMPHLSGVELVEQVRAVRPELPVILITGYERIATLDTVAASGITEFIRKPVSIEDCFG